MAIKYTDDLLRTTAADVVSMTGLLRSLGIRYASGNMRIIFKQRIAKLNIDISHWTGERWNKGVPQPHKRLKASDILINNRLHVRKEKIQTLRRALDEVGVKRECVECRLKEVWRNRPLTLQVDHIDGNPFNNEINNLRYLCPNCHSQTDTHHKTKGRMLELEDNDLSKRSGTTSRVSSNLTPAISKRKYTADFLAPFLNGRTYTDAAKMLGMSRTALRRHLKNLGIHS